MVFPMCGSAGAGVAATYISYECSSNDTAPLHPIPFALGRRWAAPAPRQPRRRLLLAWAASPCSAALAPR